MVALFVLFTFILFVVADLLVLKAQKKNHPAFASAHTNIDYSVYSKKDIHSPEGVFVSRGHTYAQKNEYGLIKVGIDEFALKAFGKLRIISAKATGQQVKQGDVLFEGRFRNRAIKFRSPVSGTVKFLNENLNKELHTVYNGDWAVLVSPENFDEDRKTLLAGKDLKMWLNDEIERFKDFLGAHTLKNELAGATMYDGGNIAEGSLSFLKEEGLTDFENQFLNI
jgi:glycine cleavage system H protein